MATILPQFDASNFQPGTPIDNPYFPVTPGTVVTHVGETEDEVEANDVFATFETREIAGVTATVVRDTAYADGVLIEDTLDWFAQDQLGNVWYLGELSFSYEYDDEGRFVGTDTDGSWEAGVVVDPETDPDVAAQPGFIMPSPEQLQAFLESGEGYFQEFAPGVAEDEAEVLSLSEEVTIEALGPDPIGNVLKTRDTTALEPDVEEFKFYAPGIGEVRVEEPDLTIDLAGIRSVGEGVPGAENEPELSDFKAGKAGAFVTVIAADGDHAIGTYGVDVQSHELGEGQILFDSTDGLTSEEAAASLEIAKNDLLGLFMIPDGGELDEQGIDLSQFEEGGLVFTNPTTFERATLEDAMAPLVSAGELSFEAPVSLPEFEGEEEVLPLPLQVYHALDGAADGTNLLNPGGGAQAVELDLENGPNVTLLSFEDRRATDPEFDGDFNDLVIAVSHQPLDAETIGEIASELGLPDDALIG